jgi:hypothetical protein
MFQGKSPFDIQLTGLLTFKIMGMKKHLRQNS